jgi:hypothetical protein
MYKIDLELINSQFLEYFLYCLTMKLDNETRDSYRNSSKCTGLRANF